MTAVYKATNLHAAAVQSRFLLAAVLAVTVIAGVVATMDLVRRHRPAKADDSSRFLLRRRPAQLPLALSLVLLLVGAIVAAGAGALTASRLVSYIDGSQQMTGSGVARTFLPAGHEVVFVQCSDFGCPTLLASDMRVGTDSRHLLLTFSDPSEDRLPVGGQTFAGVVSFTVPRSGTYVLSADSQPTWHLRLATAPGQVLAATLFAHELAAFRVHESAGFDEHGGPLAASLSMISPG